MERRQLNWRLEVQESEDREQALVLAVGGLREVAVRDKTRQQQKRMKVCVGSLGLIMLVAMITAGCDTLNHTQFQIAPAHDPNIVSAEVSDADRAEVKQILLSLADELGLQDLSHYQTSPATIAYLREPVRDFPMKLGARAVGDTIVVELIHFHPGSGETASYTTAKVLLLSKLKAAFGDRVKVVEAFEGEPLL
jgi:hypothetical protein